MTKASDCCSRVGSPFTSMNCDMWATGSNTIKNASGRCSESSTFSPGGSSTECSVISLMSSAKASSSGKSTPELQNNCLKYSIHGSACGSCAAIFRTRGLTVKVTSTISSSVGSQAAAQRGQL